jgi:transcriptional regulator GlxA family with amidase domain
MSKFEEYLAAHPGRPLYLTEICAATSIAERTLRAACEEHLGMGPIRYLALRLLIPEQVAHLFRDDAARPFRLIVARHSD